MDASVRVCVWGCGCAGVSEVRLSSGNHLKHIGMHYVCRHTFYIVSACIKPLVAVCMCSHSTHRHTPLSALKRVPTKFTTAADHTMLLGNNSMHHFTSLVPSSCTYVPWGWHTAGTTCNPCYYAPVPQQCSVVYAALWGWYHTTVQHNSNTYLKGSSMCLYPERVMDIKALCP